MTHNGFPRRVRVVSDEDLSWFGGVTVKSGTQGTALEPVDGTPENVWVIFDGRKEKLGTQLAVLEDLTSENTTTRYVIEHAYRDRPERWAASAVASILFDSRTTTFDWRKSAEADRLREMIRAYESANTEDGALALAREIAKRTALMVRVVKLVTTVERTPIETMYRG